MSIKIGIVGCGWIVENGHIPALIKNEKYTILSLFDINYDKVTSLGKKFNIDNICYSFDEFCNSGIEAAIVATPNYTHFEYTKKLIKCGIHVLCEKPVVINVQEINQLKSVLQENKVIYLPGFVNRWREDIQIIQKIVESKKIGDIIKIEAGWIRKNGVLKPGTWFTNKELSGGGVLIDLGTHILDICLMLIGDEHTDEIKVNTTMLSDNCDWGNGQAHWFGKEYGLKYKINVESGVKAAIKFANGIKLNLHLKWHGDSTADYTYFNIIGENGTIKLKTLFGFSNERQYKDSLVIKSKNEGSIDIELNHNSTSYAFDKMYEYFYKAIIEQGQSYINIQDANRVVCLIENLYKSNEKEYWTPNKSKEAIEMYEYYIGMDVGGTHVRIAYKKSNEKSYSKIIKKKFVRCETVTEELEKNIIQLIDYVIKINSQGKLVGIGIAMAPLIDKKTGVIKEWPNNIKWREVPILELLKSTYGIDVVIEDDANAAALGEKLVGNAINRENFVYVTISTGIGCAIVLNNRLLVGEHGWCGELGHIRVSNSTERCNCGATGCLQAIASGPAMLKYYKNITGIQNASLNEIANESMNGKKEAVQVIKEATQNIGLAISNLVILLDVSLIIIGGGVLNLGNIFSRCLEKEIYTNLFQRRQVELKYSQLTDVNGVYGAISIIMDRMKK